MLNPIGEQSAVIALIGLLGIGAQWIAWRTDWPAIALMLAAGVIAGPVIGLINPQHTFGALLEPMVSIAVAIILFEGGLSLNFRELRRTDGAVTRLVLLGVPVGWVLGALACYYVAGLVWPVAILFGGILVVTGPTVVIPLLRQSNIAPRPRAILKWEAIVNDPFGALCGLITYEYLRRSAAGGTFGSVIVSLVAAAVVAGLLGWVVARIVGVSDGRQHRHGDRDADERSGPHVQLPLQGTDAAHQRGGGFRKLIATKRRTYQICADVQK